MSAICPRGIFSRSSSGGGGGGGRGRWFFRLGFVGAIDQVVSSTAPFGGLGWGDLQIHVEVAILGVVGTRRIAAP